MFVTRVRGSLDHWAQYSGEKISQCISVWGGEGRMSMSGCEVSGIVWVCGWLVGEDGTYRRMLGGLDWRCR
jgi:hypothetical protein